MNSEPVIYDLKKFYTYEEFKKFPKDIAISYLQRLTDTYHVGARGISYAVFDLSANALDAYLRKHLMYDRIKWNSFTGNRGSAYLAQLKRDVEAARKEEQTETVEEIKMEVPADISVEELAKEQTEEPVKTISKERLATEEIRAVRRHSGTYTNDQVASLQNLCSNQTIYNTTKVEECPIPKPKQGRILKTSMIFDGFDMETFLFLSKRYEGQDIIIELNIRERGDENA